MPGRGHDPRSVLPGLTLAGAVYGFVFVTSAAILLGAALLFVPRSERLIDEALASAVQVRSQAAADMLARQLFFDWQDLGHVVAEVPTMSEPAIAALLDGLQGDGSRISWAGYANLDGTVLAATDGLLTGADVSARPWFRNGLRGEFAGDVHEALLLARTLPEREIDSPLRLLDLSRPVRNAQGDVIGVVGIHVDFAWTERSLTEFSRLLGLDLYLVTAEGRVVVASRGDRPAPEDVEILRAARAGSTLSGRATWPDGRDYFSTLIPSVDHGDLPNFGWRLVGRLDADAFRPGLASLRATVVMAGCGLVVILVAMSVLFVAIFVRPFASLADAADRMSEGEDVYPPEHPGTREAARIGGSLARLQDRLASAARR